MLILKLSSLTHVIPVIRLTSHPNVGKVHSLNISREGCIVYGSKWEGFPDPRTRVGFMMREWPNTKLRRYWEIHPGRLRNFPRPERFPEDEALGKFSLGDVLKGQVLSQLFESAADGANSTLMPQIPHIPQLHFEKPFFLRSFGFSFNPNMTLSPDMPH